MKYMTRSLYEGYQPYFLKKNNLSAAQIKEAQEKWDEAVNTYRKQLQSIKSSLPLSVKKLSHISFHDAIVKDVVWRSKDELILELDGAGCPWGVRGQLTLAFKDVKRAEIPEGLKGDYWLYEEIHFPKGAGRFDFQALLDHSEFRVIADNLELWVDGKHYQSENNDSSDTE